jgi:hypothetical protein
MVFHQGPSQSHIYITMLYAWLVSCSLQVLEMTTSGRSKMSNRLVGVVGSGLLTTQVYPSTILVSVLWPITLPSPPTQQSYTVLMALYQSCRGYINKVPRHIMKAAEFIIKDRIFKED